MVRREVPEPWATAMIQRGFVYAKRPSIRALARAADIPSAETVRQLIHGESDPGQDTIRSVADALKVRRTEVSSWVGQARTVEHEWQPPADMNLLTPSEQAAITALIEAIARPRKTRPVDLRDHLNAVIVHARNLGQEQLARTLEARLGALEEDDQAGPGADVATLRTRGLELEYDTEAAHHSSEPAGQVDQS